MAIPSGGVPSLSYKTALTFLLFIILTNSAYTYFQRGVWPGLTESFDFGVFYTASKVIFEGQAEHLYDIEWFYDIGSQPYQYFPFFAIIIYPLSLFSFETARILWMLINQLVILSTAILIFKGIGNRELPIVLGVFILLLGFGPMDANMYWGQVNAVVMLCVVSSWYFYKSNRPLFCGIMIAVGTIIKITPAILGVYFLYKRAYKVILGGIYGATGCFLFSIIVLGGVDEHIAWFTDMLPFLTNDEGMGKAGQVLNQSFLGTYIRLSQLNVISMTAAPTLHTVSEFAVLLICFAFFKFSPITPEAREFDLEFAAVTCLMVLMPPTVIVQHFVYFLPVYFCLFSYIIKENLYSIPLFICIGISYTMVSLGAFGGAFFSQWPFVIMQSSKLIGVLLIFATIGFLLLKNRGVIGRNLMEQSK